MPSPDSPDHEHLRQFRAQLSEMSSEEIHGGLNGLLDPSGRTMRRPKRPDLRRPPLEEPALLTLRVDLEHAVPPIWRRLELRSDLTLEEVHGMLQTAFGWFDAHLWRFAAGGHPFDLDSQLFLCPFDVEEGEEEGLPASQVRLDEVLSTSGDRLAYVYDYGDDWQLRLRLESVRPAGDGSPPVRALSGRRAAPPEDCGGLTRAEELAEVLSDPAHFDLAELQCSLELADVDPETFGAPPVLTAVLGRIPPSPLREDLLARTLLMTTASRTPELDERRTALRAVSWFVDRAAAGGLDLTSAGYLAPQLVEAASQVVPEMIDWIGKNNREINAIPLLHFREALKHLKILRTFKGQLLPTRRARPAVDDPDTLWSLLAESLIPAPGSFAHDATVLLLAHIGSTPSGAAVDPRATPAALDRLGWRTREGGAVDQWMVRDLPAAIVLRNITPEQGRRAVRGSWSDVARALAREALAQG
ncbi:MULTISPECIES: plasmid pRiA4b ORF-3 family protein [unclassified Brachybacterium]|uniref:plasmid pRiA4b ORF-3 family protein n=1 Tax=unclassified Brachybacterium TaxID=2623841 RepID=UPI00402ACA19